jgi:hypothetical protein
MTWINAILHHGYMGQDYLPNADAAAQAVAAPHWLVYVGTNTPATFWLAALVHWATGSASYVAATSFVLLVANTVALYIWWLLAKATIREASLRVAAMVALAFLPTRLIHSVVYAGDAVVVLPYTLALWLSYELFRATEPRKQMKLAVALSAALLAAIASKYTTASAVPIVLLLLFAFRRDFRSREVLLATFILTVELPAGLAAFYRHVYNNLPTTDWRRIFWGHEMNWRSLLLPRMADLDVFRAPGYLDVTSIGGADAHTMLVPNLHSYMGMLQYSIFTDPLNIFQYDATDSYFGARDDAHQRLMTFAVRWAVPLSLLMIAGTVTYAVRAVGYFRALREGPAARRLPVLLVLLFSAAFFANVALVLPFVREVYHAGYWTSRLVLPAVLGFVLLGFTLLDEHLRWRGARLAVLAYCLVHAVANTSFLWMRGA